VFRVALWRSDRASGVTLVLLAILVAWGTTHALPIGTLSRPGPGYMPLILAAVMAVMGAVVAWRGADSIAFGAMRWGEVGHAVKILAACAFVALALERLGYRLTMFAMVLVLLAIVERRPFILSLVVSGGLAFGSYWLFNDVLKTPLPSGLLGF
jgi:hypothetical protein